MIADTADTADLVIPVRVELAIPARVDAPVAAVTSEAAEAAEVAGAAGAVGTVVTDEAGTAPNPPSDPPPAPGTGRLARNLGALAGGQVVTWVMTLVWTLIVPRAIGPADFGILVAAQSVGGVLGILLGMGNRNYLVRETVIDPAAGPKLVGTAIVVRLAAVPVVGVAAVMWTSIAHEGHRAAMVLYLITAMTVLTLLTEPLQAALQAIERMQYLAYIDIVNKTAQSLVGIALVFLGLRVVGIAADMAIIAAVVLLLTWCWLRAYFHVDVRTNVTRMVQMTRQSLSYWAFGLFGMIYFWIDTIMLSLMAPEHVVGWYGATTNLFQTLMFLPVLMQTAWLPRLVSAFVIGRDELARASRAPVELVVAAALPIAVATAVLAGPVIHVIYGSGFAHAVPVLIGLAFCIPPIYLNMVLGTVLVAAKRQRIWAGAMAGAAVVNPILNLVLIPLTEHRYHNGAIGAAISLVATEVLIDIAFILATRDVFDRRLVTRCGSVLVASAGMAGAAYAARPLGAALSLAAGLVALSGLAAALRIVGPAERELVRGGIGMVAGRLGRARG